MRNADHGNGYRIMHANALMKGFFIMNIGFIGAGKAGTALGRYLADHGNIVVGYASATAESARSAASFTRSRAFEDPIDLVKASDLVFITTPDGAIGSVWHDLVEAHDRGSISLASKIIVHCSGCCSSAVFIDAHLVGAFVCSAHPFLAFGDRRTAHEQLASAHFTVEGDARALVVVVPLLEKAGNSVHELSADEKTRYHAAAVFASNLVLAPLSTAVQLLCECGFSATDARAALAPLIRGNIENFIQLGAAGALTGPVERSDITTVESHLGSLDQRQRSLYCALTRELVAIAQQKHPDRDYSDWQNFEDR